MATSQAASAPTAAAAAGGGGTTSTTSKTIVGSHIFKIEGFSATKDFGVGKSVKSSTFRVGGHDWYVECYPCGLIEGNAGWVYLNLCRPEDYRGNRVSAKCKFTLMESLKDGCFKKLTGHPSKLVTLADDDRHSLSGIDFMERKRLEWLLKDDCLHLRCVVFIEKFPAAPTLGIATGSHVLTVDNDYSKTRRAFSIGEAIESTKFRVGDHSWCLDFYPCGEDENNDGRITVNLSLDDPGDNNEVKVRFELTLRTHDGHIISSTQDFSTFSERSDEYVCNFLIMMEHESSPLLQAGIQIRCDIAVVNGITATPNLGQCICGDLKASQQVRVRGDVTFEVGGHLFPAHKYILATRCTAFMSNFFAASGEKNTGVTDCVRVNDMEPRVFEALLHFIYTDALPEVRDENMFVVAQGLLVAADRYAMERLKLICVDILATYVNDARTAVTMLELADKHGCSKLKEVCMKLLKGHFAIGAP